jgi:hypothetical protein
VGTRRVTNCYYFGETAGEPKTGELRNVDYADTLTTNLESTYSRVGLTASVADAAGTRQFADAADTLALETETLDAAWFPGRMRKHLTAPSGVRGRSIGYELKLHGTTLELEVGYGYDAATGRFNLLREGPSQVDVGRFARSAPYSLCPPYVIRTDQNHRKTACG